MVAAAASPSRNWPDLFWSASDLDRSSSWRCELPVDVGDEFVEFVTHDWTTTAVAFHWDSARLPRMAAFGQVLRSRLLTGEGLCWLQKLDELGLGEEHLRCLFVAIGCAIGDPMLQYGRLYPVVDRGASYKTQAVPVSMTNAETCFHTDSSSVDVVPDVIGLLCEQPSDRGGDSLVSNALRVYETLRSDHPEVLAILARPWIRDVITPGKEKTQANLLRNRFPVFANSDRPGGVLFRYMRYWIEVGQEKAGMPLDEEQKRAFDLLDQLLELPENVFRFRLERGDAILVNNRILAHNRTAYEDSPGNVRQLQRMWLQIRAAAGVTA